MTPAEFWERYGPLILFDPVTGCWLWQGALRGDGYVHVRVGERMVLLHRLSLEVHRPGELTDEKPCACHSCDLPNCINPAHLWAGTVAENNQDMIQKGRHGMRTRPESRPRGERNGRTRLTEAHVRDIIRRRASGESSTALALEFGVSYGAVEHIVHGRSWRHLRADNRMEAIA
jgi:hypothetical protein